MHITASVQRRTGGVFLAPLYKGPGRTGLRYVDALQLRTDQPASKWTLRGVCVLCSKD